MEGAGAFGKMPAAGDFVARGLTAEARVALDRWLTAHLAEAARDPDAWPDWGLRAAIPVPGGDLVALILPSVDRAGRRYPFALVAPLGGADLRGVDAWADDALDLALDAVDGVIDVDALAQGLADLDTPDRGRGQAVAAPALWRRGAAPEAPDAALSALFPGLGGTGLP
ncbi:MAG: type VI secretion system-associated protein TagF [Rhodobacteraceae bacterium]|jgi:type VI secretion system protein ImpM|nr:type VI secretion system-associated protein TagF [Paracoccaceae bacterium]